MFTKVNKEKILPQQELFFYAIDLRTVLEFAKKQAETTGNRPDSSLYNLIIHYVLHHFSKFRKLVVRGRVVCTLKTKFVVPDDFDFAREIKQLQPYVIDWSNLPDYFKRAPFIRFSRKCSNSETVHAMHFMNWVYSVFGSVHTDWSQNLDKLEKVFMTEKDQLETVSRSLKTGLFDLYFKEDKHENLKNKVDLILSQIYHPRFEKHFFRTEDGLKSLNSEKVHQLQPFSLYRFFTKNTTTFSTVFTFNDDINLNPYESLL